MADSDFFLLVKDMASNRKKLEKSFFVLGLGLIAFLLSFIRFNLGEVTLFGELLFAFAIAATLAGY